MLMGDNLESCERSKIELFCESSQQLKAGKYFRKKGPKQMFHFVLNMSLQFMQNEIFFEDVTRFCSARNGINILYV